MNSSTLMRGNYYNTLASTKNYSDELKAKIEETIQKFLNNETNMNRPGMLLGKIQGGKTNAFIGIIALAFDNNYDMSIILTKGTKALARQTQARLKKDFRTFIDYDMVKLYDVLNIPERLPGYILKQKLIIIAKKEKQNLDKIIRTFVQTYPDLSKRKVLIIDDEADFASIGFSKNREEGIFELRKIASQIDELRKKVDKSDFLQVTATPYSLYLQPEDLAVPRGGETYIFKPIRPKFTVLLPIYKGYIGGDFFFRESKDENSIAYFVYEEVPVEELDALRKPNRHVFKIEECLTHKRIATLRRGILNFIVGSCIRRIQQRLSQKREEKYSFVVHTEQGREAHDWQVEVVSEFKRLLIYSAHHDLPALSELVRESYNDLSKSLSINDKLPTYNKVFDEVLTALKDDYINIVKVNSDVAVVQLLDDNGELELSAPLNIFIGGQILDRGVTIRNFIGFYYGRRPSRFQQDTVLQHSRIFGDRQIEDLAVTRFYTSFDIYSALEKINESDNALRDAFEKEAQSGVVFICKDPSNRILPCSPNKIAISSTTTLTPHKRMLPTHFQTDYKTNIRSTLEELDRVIISKVPAGDKNKPFLIELSMAQSIIDMIYSMLIFERGWDIEAFKASLEFLSKNSDNPTMQGKVWCIVRTGRKISRFKSDGATFSDAPDTPQDELEIAYQTAIDIPALILLRQEGLKKQDWMDSPFWWPVMVAPKKMRPVIFASELIDIE